MPIPIPQDDPGRVIPRPVAPPRLAPSLGLRNFGGGPEAAGTVRAAQQGLGIQQDQIVREQLRADQLRLSEEKRAADAWWIKTLTDPQTGAVNRKGKAAIGITPELVGQWDKFVQDRVKGLGNDRQKRLFKESAEGRRLEIMRWGSQHEGRQLKVLEEAEHQARLESSKERASVSPEVRDTELIDIRLEVQAWADRNGLGAEAARQELQRHETDLHARVIEGMMSREEYGRAQEYLDGVQNRMDPDVVTKIAPRVKGAVEESGVRARSQEEADRIMDMTSVTVQAGGGTATVELSEFSPSEQKRLRLQEARKLDGRLRDITVDRVEQRIREEERIEAEAYEELLDGSLDSILQAQEGAIEDIIPAAEFNRIKPTDQMKLRQIRNRMLNPDLSSNPEVLADFWATMSPEDRAKLSREKLLAMRAAMTPQDWETAIKQVGRDREALRDGEINHRKLMESDINAMIGRIIEVPKGKSTGAKERAAEAKELQSRVKSAFNDEFYKERNRLKGQNPSEEWQRSTLRRLLHPHIQATIDGFWRNPEVVVQNLTSGDYSSEWILPERDARKLDSVLGELLDVSPSLKSLSAERMNERRNRAWLALKLGEPDETLIRIFEEGIQWPEEE